MLILRTFNEAARTSIQFRVLQDQALVLIGLTEEPYHFIDSALDITEDDIAWLLRQPEAKMSYSDIIGGNIYICETEDDLLQVEGCDFDFAQKHGRWPNVTEVPLAFDDCKFLQEKSGEQRWVLFLTCWNDAGGSVYFIPRRLWRAANVEAHITATSGFWRGGEDGTN